MTPATDDLHDEEIVLIVDDDEGMRQSLVDLLTVEGIRTVVAGRADEALDLAVVHDPTVVVVDYQLPDRSGIELAQTLKERNPDLPVLLLTGFASLDMAVAAVGRLDAYLIKPVAPQMFLQTVVHAMTRRRLIAENRALIDRLQAVNAHQALYDPLTGLPNRALLDQRLAQALEECRRTECAMAVLFIDLDHFKVLNDLFGHQVGDRVLQSMAGRLKDAVRATDSVARFGGDEFVIVCPDVDGMAEACRLAARALDALARPTTIDGVEHNLTGSIGIAVTGRGAPRQNEETLLRNADTAMYRAKEGGRGRWELFDSGMRVQVMERFEIERGLRTALDDDDLTLAYQPCVDIRTGSVVGAEALLRWDRPGHGTMLPESFLDVAEDAGLVVPIGAWVLERTLSDLAHWQATGRLSERFRLWVNVSPQELANPRFAEHVHERMESHGVSPDHVGLEILEKALLDVAEVEKVLTALRAMGVSINLDDFGSGYSNLWQLQELPISGLKIDRRFIAKLDVPGDNRGSAIVSGMISLGHSLGLSVVAEGVETGAQAAALFAMGCEFAQGYFYGFPGSSEQLWQLEAHWREERHPELNGV